MGRDVNGKDVIIVDDMISSGESVIDVANNLKKSRVQREYSYLRHSVFSVTVLSALIKRRQTVLLIRFSQQT